LKEGEKEEERRRREEKRREEKGEKREERRVLLVPNRHRFGIQGFGIQDSVCGYVPPSVESVCKSQSDDGNEDASCDFTTAKPASSSGQGGGGRFGLDGRVGDGSGCNGDWGVEGRRGGRRRRRRRRGGLLADVGSDVTLWRNRH
jgi:hypothetical protein